MQRYPTGAITEKGHEKDECQDYLNFGDVNVPGVEERVVSFYSEATPYLCYL